MTEGHGGFWNRAGRRSGGARPFEIAVVPEYTCARCHVTTAFGLLEPRLLHFGGQSVRAKCCPSGCGVILVQHDDGRWMAPADLTRGHGERTTNG